MTDKITLKLTTDIFKLSDYSPSNVTIYDKDGQVLLKEPSLMAFLKSTKNVIAIGNDAYGVVERVQTEMESFNQLNSETKQKTLDTLKKLRVNINDFNPDNIIVGSPLQNGVVADLIAARKLFRYLTQKAFGYHLFKPHIVICNPGEVTSVMRDMLIAVMIDVGCKSAMFINKSYNEVRHEIPSKCKFVVEIEY